MTTRVCRVGDRVWLATPVTHRVNIMRPGEWGNPIKLESEADRQRVLCDFKELCRRRGDHFAARVRRHLQGKVLGCCCAPLPCHGDVLAAIADGREP